MNKTIRLSLALAIVMMAASSCKTKQKIAEIPAGSNIEASAPKSTISTATVTQPEVSQPVVNESEVTRNENFSLVEGGAEAMKFKYHVVVGSFTKQTNAKGLQTSLISEGNKAIVVVNEKGMFRVLISSFNNYNQAHARIKEIANRFADAWVLVQK
jgi:cell division protein FtsN